jgi:hypothetical protein
LAPTTDLHVGNLVLVDLPLTGEVEP